MELIKFISKYAFINVVLQVGFDAGDGINFYNVTGSCTVGIKQVTSLSNLQVKSPGKYVFRLFNASTTNSIECENKNSSSNASSSNVPLVAMPSNSDIMGHRSIVITRRCQTTNKANVRAK